MKNIWRSDNRLNMWMMCWVDMICGLIGILTLSYFRPWWDFSIRAWTTKKYFNSN